MLAIWNKALGLKASLRKVSCRNEKICMRLVSPITKVVFVKATMNQVKLHCFGLIAKCLIAKGSGQKNWLNHRLDKKKCPQLAIRVTLQRQG